MRDGEGGRLTERAIRTAWAAAALLLACGCARQAPRGETAAAQRARTSAPDFLAPPALRRAERDPVGGVTVHGSAPPGARVLLASPAGERLEAPVDADGGWALSLGPSAVPRAYALSAVLPGGRTLRGEGALAVAPAPALPAFLLRGGASSWPAGPAPGREPLQLALVDSDGGGGAAVAGFAPPNSPVRLLVDGVAAGAGQADASGRFGLLAVGAPLRPGPHVIELHTPTAALTRQVRLEGPAGLDAPMRADRTPEGWRISWSPPGGGVQTTLALDPAPSASASAP